MYHTNITTPISTQQNNINVSCNLVMILTVVLITDLWAMLLFSGLAIAFVFLSMGITTALYQDIRCSKVLLSGVPYLLMGGYLLFSGYNIQANGGDPAYQYMYCQMLILPVVIYTLIFFTVKGILNVLGKPDNNHVKFTNITTAVFVSAFTLFISFTTLDNNTETSKTNVTSSFDVPPDTTEYAIPD